jgi:hypothetical protein
MKRSRLEPPRASRAPEGGWQRPSADWAREHSSWAPRCSGRQIVLNRCQARPAAGSMLVRLRLFPLLVLTSGSSVVQQYH